MVGPIDYRMNVLDPIQGYLQGLKFAEDRETVRLGREATRQGMDIQAAQEARAAEAFQMQKSEAARKVAEAQRGQQVLSQLFSNPNPTSEDFTQAFVANPAIREEIKFLMDRQTAEQTRGQLVAAQNVYAAAAQRNPEVLGRILTEQRDAMAASGNEPMVKLLDEGLRLLEADPETAMQQLRASTGLTILGLGGDVQKINEAIGVAEGPDFRPATREEAAAYGAASGQINVRTGEFKPINPPSGMALRTTPGGGVEVVQGPGAGATFREQETKDIIYATRAEGALADLEPVASQLANLTPRLFEYVPLGQGRQFQTPEYQRANVAAMEFLAAILRKDTGAAITQQEIEIYGQTYLPQPGDSQQVLEQKARARRRAIEALRAPMSEAAQGAVAGALTAGSRIRYDAEGNRIND